MSAVVNRVLSGGQRATRKTINAFVGKNNFALQELRPPNPAELIQGTKQIALFPYRALGGELKLLSMTTTEAAQYALVFAEVYVWFCVGECIGKGSIIGYNV